MKYPYPVVEIVWIDAESGQGWEDPSETDHQVPEVMTIGFLIYDDKSSVTVAATACKQKTTNNRLKIPRGMIKSLKVIRRVAKQ